MDDGQVDLSKLALDRGSENPAARKRARKHWFSRYLFPLGILVGFLALLAASAGREWFPTRSVTVVPVVVMRSDRPPAGQKLFQAAGWIEPRPTATSVPALAAGVIEELLVVEGQHVMKGEPIARLIAIDAELAVKQAAAKLKLCEGELQGAEAERNAALIRLEQPVHLTVQVADAEGLLAKARTEMDKLPFLIEAALATLKFTGENVEGKRAAVDSLAGRVVQQAESDHALADASVRELRGRQPNLQREVDALQNKVSALKTQLELLVEERRQLQEAEAKIVSAGALRDEAELQLRQAELNRERTTVRAPIDGCILRLLASPGTSVTGLKPMAGPGAGAVVEMYDPKRLQVRADVRLEDVPEIFPGAPVEIETASSRRAIQGRVLQSTSTANVQKNTLEVKVELIDPPPTVRPEMLVTATFLAPKSERAIQTAREVERLFLPKQLVTSIDGESFVWIVSAENQAVKRKITLGPPGQDGLLEAVEGLRVTDKLIASETDNLQSGDAVNVTGEDSTIGMER